MEIALLHTAEIHVATFDRLFRRLAPKARLMHVVAEELLDRARAHGVSTVRDDTASAVANLSRADAVLCTCSTLGGIAEQAGALRVDRPLMKAACEHGPNVLVTLCLESTRGPTIALLEETAQADGVEIAPETLLLDTLWPEFEAGRVDLFSDRIANAVSGRIARGGVDCVVLAQASMAGAQTRLADCGVPVFSSPELAARAAVARAAQASSLV